MPTPADFLQYFQWSAIALGACAVLAGLAFIFKWGVRFRLVGATGFMLVLAAGFFALSFIPLSRTVIPNALRYTLVYDSSGSQAVIVVPVDITESQLVATLQQAASDLFTPGRIGRDTNQLTIQARAILHPKPGVSQILGLGQVQRSLSIRDDPNQTITIAKKNLVQPST